MISKLRFSIGGAYGANYLKHGLPSLDFLDKHQGIVHVINPEQVFTLPGITLVCGDNVDWASLHPG